MAAAQKDTKKEAPVVDRPKNNVQVSANRSKFLYADITKHLLAGGEKDVVISALGLAIADAVGVAEMLKNQEMVTVTRIHTSRGEESGARSHNADKIEITVAKSKAFDAKYAEQQKIREERKATKEAEAKKE